jgi:mono/diheme cytochrome c family protein
VTFKRTANGSKRDQNRSLPLTARCSSCEILMLRLLLAGLVLLAGFLLLPTGQAGGRGGSPPDARPEPEGKVPGFRLTIENGPAKDVASARLVAIYVPAGTRPSPFVPPGPFRATWQGEFNLELPEDLTFSAEGRGKLTFLIKEKVILELSGDDFASTPGKKIEVPGESTPFTVVYEAPATGDASVRLSWKGDNFVREPVSFAFVKHDPTTKEHQAATNLREGRELTTSLHCVNCHQADTATLVKNGGMPELAADAPSLATLGSRVHRDWLAHWLQDPQALRPQATMPRLLAPSEKGPGPEARDLAAYLVTLGASTDKEEPAIPDEIVTKGARLFAHLGCVACHLMPTREDVADAEYHRIPLKHVVAKWKPTALRAFLRQPSAHYRWIRMPDFGLSADEANQLAGYLLRAAKPTLPSVPHGDATRGKELLTTKGCLACHAVTEDRKLSPPTALNFASLKRLDAGCLAGTGKPGGKTPVYALSDAQRAALRTALPQGENHLKYDAPIDVARRTMSRLRCDSCHQRDGREDAWSRLRDESDALLTEYPGEDAEKDAVGQTYPAVQLRPPLTWTGEKLRPEWLTDFLTGKIPYKPRPYLRARMPHFTGPLDGLARGLVLEHGRAPASLPQSALDQKVADVGRILASKKNWGCVACHNVGKSVAEAAFEAPGINFQYVRDRLTRDYYERWVYSPLRVEPGTRMPAVFQPGKPSLLKEFYDGSADKQVEALWQYLLEGDRIKYPEE